MASPRNSATKNNKHAGSPKKKQGPKTVLKTASNKKAQIISPPKRTRKLLEKPKSMKKTCSPLTTKDESKDVKKKPKVDWNERWKQVYEAADQSVQGDMQVYRENGFIIKDGVFSKDFVNVLLEGEADLLSSLIPQSERPQRRARIVREQWIGAKRVISLNREIGGGVCAIRMKGRYDLPLPPRLASLIESELETNGVMKLLRSICPSGKIRTQNIMLSAPGSERQPVHTDSSWAGCPHVDPLPHYITVLIPMTNQDEETGGTRIWPKSHRDFNMALKDDNFMDVIEPHISIGDALIFDGLLSHCGMENKSKDRDRYFFYLAFSTRHDPNTDVTG